MKDDAASGDGVRIAHLTTADISLALLLATELSERVAEGHTVLGISAQWFHFDDAEGRARLRAQWGVANDEILVGTVGRRVFEKGIAEYAAAAKALQSRARFVWVGPEDDTDTWTHDASTGAVKFIAEQTDMPAVYSAFDIFVLASYREGFSRAAMEAAACGRPTILGDIRGCREIGTHVEHLLLAPARDGSSRACAVGRLVRSGTLRRHVAEQVCARTGNELDQRRAAHDPLPTYCRVQGRTRGLP